MDSKTSRILLETYHEFERAPPEQADPASEDQLVASATAYHLAGSALDTNDLAEAERQCRRALQGSPLSGEAHQRLSAVLRRRGALDEAIELLWRALALSGDSAGLLCALADALRQRGEPTAAGECLAKAEALFQQASRERWARQDRTTELLRFFQRPPAPLAEHRCRCGALSGSDALFLGFCISCEEYVHPHTALGPDQRGLLLSPEKLLEWSYGEVTEPYALDEQTGLPAWRGLRCPRIFGPERDFACHCGRYSGVEHTGIVCERCRVEVLLSLERRYRPGHLQLAAPVLHPSWHLGRVSRVAILLDHTTTALGALLRGSYLMLDPGGTACWRGEILTPSWYARCRDRYGYDFEATTGAAAVREYLRQLDLPGVRGELLSELSWRRLRGSRKRYARELRRLEVLETFAALGWRPEWVALEVLPVLPPELPLPKDRRGRPRSRRRLEARYAQVLAANRLVRGLLEACAPEEELLPFQQELQASVDALFSFFW